MCHLTLRFTVTLTFSRKLSRVKSQGFCLHTVVVKHLFFFPSNCWHISSHIFLFPSEQKLGWGFCQSPSLTHAASLSVQCFSVGPGGMQRRESCSVRPGTWTYCVLRLFSLLEVILNITVFQCDMAYYVFGFCISFERENIVKKWAE